jgi:hypothetical protein
METMLSTSLLAKQPSKSKKPESKLYQDLKKYQKKNLSKSHLTRIETTVSLGFPDIFYSDPRGVFHLLELKTSPNFAVKISPHQLSFMLRHQNSSAWVLVRGLKTMELYLYHSSQIMGLSESGLRFAPKCKTSDFGDIFDNVSRETFR